MISSPNSCSLENLTQFVLAHLKFQLLRINCLAGTCFTSKNSFSASVKSNRFRSHVSGSYSKFNALDYGKAKGYVFLISYSLEWVFINCRLPHRNQKNQIKDPGPGKQKRQIWVRLSVYPFSVPTHGTHAFCVPSVATSWSKESSMGGVKILSAYSFLSFNYEDNKGKGERKIACF